MSVLFIADLHLTQERSDITEAFLSFLTHKAPTCETLYILGDFFHVWVGDDAMGDFEYMIAQQLHHLADQGVKIYLMHGNRDFAIGKRFCKLAGCTLLKDPVRVVIYGMPVLLSHGDLYCTKDLDYLKKRRLLRNPLVLFVARHFPLKWRQKIADNLREESRRKKGTKSAAITDVTPEVIPPLLEKHQLQVLIHGHTHRPAVHHLMADGKPAQRIVLGDWEPNGKIVRATPQGFSLECAVD